MAEETAAVPIKQYRGIYEKTASEERDVLSESLGEAVWERKNGMLSWDIRICST